MGKARRSRQIREQERRRTRTRRMLIATGTAVVVVIALVAVQQLTSGGSKKVDPTSLTGVPTVQSEFADLTEHKGTIGAASAKVTIVEYGDLICPICKQFDDTVAPQIVQDIVRPGTAKLQFRDWPIVGPSSPDAAKAAYAAAQQNKLWRFASLTYLNQGDETQAWFTPTVARALAKSAGLNVAKFDKDRASAAAAKAITTVNGEAETLGFQGTPSIRVVGPKGSITVDATFDSIASGVQQVSGSGE